MNTEKKSWKLDKGQPGGKKKADNHTQLTDRKTFDTDDNRRCRARRANRRAVVVIAPQRKK